MQKTEEQDAREETKAQAVETDTAASEHEVEQEPPKEEAKKQQLYWPDGTPFVDYAA